MDPYQCEREDSDPYTGEPKPEISDASKGLELDFAVHNAGKF